MKIDGDCHNPDTSIQFIQRAFGLNRTCILKNGNVVSTILSNKEFESLEIVQETALPLVVDSECKFTFVENPLPSFYKLSNNIILGNGSLYYENTHPGTYSNSYSSFQLKTLLIKHHFTKTPLVLSSYQINHSQIKDIKPILLHHKHPFVCELLGCLESCASDFPNSYASDSSLGRLEDLRLYIEAFKEMLATYSESLFPKDSQDQRVANYLALCQELNIYQRLFPAFSQLASSPLNQSPQNDNMAPGYLSLALPTPSSKSNDYHQQSVYSQFFSNL